MGAGKVSVKSVDANELGLAVDGFSQTVAPKTYPAGTYFLGPAYSIVKFPTTQQTIVFSSSPASSSDAQAQADGPALPCRTRDGLPITISFSFNYVIQPSYEALLDLYISFGTANDVDVLYQRIAKNVVRTVAGNYDASEFFVNKEAIRVAMFNALRTDLIAQSGNLQAFNLLDVGVPKALSAAISAQQNAQQDISKAQNELFTASISAASRVQANQTVAQLLVSQAQVTAKQLQQQVTSQIESLQARYSAEAQAYKALKTSLNLTPQQLLNYVWLDAHADANAKGDTISSIVRVSGPDALA